MFPAQLVAHVPYAVICPLVGIVLVVIYEVSSTKNDMVMDMSLVNVRRQNILMLPFGYSVGKLRPISRAYSGVVSPGSKDCMRWWAKLLPLSDACERVYSNSMSAVSG